MEKTRKTVAAKDLRRHSEDVTIPVWLQATESFYKKLSKVAKESGLSRYETLSRGLDSLLREIQTRESALNKAIKNPKLSEGFRRTMGQVSRNYWATLTAEDRRLRAQRSANARWVKRKEDLNRDEI